MSTLKLDTLSNKAGTASVPSDTIVSGTAKAWVNFNGTGTVAIRQSFNVSSITDIGTGHYRVNFTNAMLDADYSVIVLAGSSSSSTNYRTFLHYSEAPTTTTFRVLFNNAGDTAQVDVEYVNVAVFR